MEQNLDELSDEMEQDWLRRPRNLSLEEENS